MIGACCPIIPFKGKMLTTDLDGTMLIPSNEHMKINVEDRTYSEKSIYETEKAVRRNGIDSVLLNTGRNFTELCEVEDILKRSELPIEAISLEDGKRLLKRPWFTSTQDWMRMLFDKNTNYRYFEDSKWTKKTEAPLKAIGDFLTEEKGFIHRNDNGEKLIYSRPINPDDPGVIRASEGAIWTVTIVPPGIKYEVSVRDLGENDIIDTEMFNEQISAEIGEMLKNRGFQTQDTQTKKQEIFVNNIERDDVSKGSVADYVKAGIPNVTGEIRAGNAGNDISMLKTEDPKVQSVVVGNDATIRKLLESQFNVTYVPTGELGSGIDRANARLNLTV